MKSHLKRHPAPNSWKIKRKGVVFITRPYPGAHAFSLGISINTFLKTLVPKASSTAEVKKILLSNTVMVDGSRVKESKYLIGVWDSISIKESKEHYRLILSSKGELQAIAIDEKDAGVKPCQITGKTLIKGGKVQLHLSDGRNILVDKDSYSTQDLVLLSLPKQEIKTHVGFGKGVSVFFIGGSYVGKTGIVEDIKDEKIICKVDGESVETLKRFAFVLGKEKSLIALSEK
tara:strand:+ start:141 stop:833 length:693 start_codon:yes stop_codon:yes gene_type:complete